MSAIRPARESDIENLAALAEHCFVDTFGHLYSQDNLTQHVQKTCSVTFFAHALQQDHIAVAEEKERLVGYIKYGEMGLPVEPVLQPSAEIHRLYVHPDYQQKGIGSQLMQHALDDPLLQNAHHYYLSVYEDNLPAQTFYQRYGFAIIGEYNYYVGAHIDRELIMYKQDSE